MVEALQEPLAMAARAAVIYIAVLAMVRLGEQRFLGKTTAFDIILGIILGSVASRAINGDAPLIPTLVAVFVLVTLHWLFAHLAFRSARIGPLVKGQSRVLVKDGEVQWDQMAASDITEKDLHEALRASGGTDNLKDVREARLERSGQISVVRAEREP